MMMMGHTEKSLIAEAGATQPSAERISGRAVVNMKVDRALLQRIDRAAKSLGITRTAWMHVAAAKALDPS
jgi:hypothetical protein